MCIMAPAIILFAACNPSPKQQAKEGNPFFTKYQTPFEVPPFDKIDTTHYMPAFIEGMKQHNQKIEEIINSKEAPTFENTILPYDKSGKLLNKVSNVFYNLQGANTNDQIQAIARKLSPLTSKHYDEIALNQKLFNRIKTVYEKRNEMNLDANQIRVVEKYYRDFERNGANLSPEKKEKLKEINAEIANISLQLDDHQRAETNDNFQMVIDNKKDLAGLPQGVIDAAAQTAKEKGLEGKWVFTLAKPSMIPFLQYAQNRELRQKLYTGYFSRGNNDNKFDNKQLLSKIFQLRVKKANLLGFDCFADYMIDNNMAKTTAKAEEFLLKLWNAALPIAKKEVKDMQKIINKEGGKFKLQSWDWWYYAEKLRKQKYDLDENELKPYFKLSNVRDGMFHVANKLYGITFIQRTDLPIYHPEVETFEVKEADGSHLGIIYFDYYPRSSKSVGAWCTGFRSAGWEDGKKVDPIVSIVCNFTKPNGDTPSLLNLDEVTTLFHEFGHGLHGLFSKGKYDRTAGSVPRDYVELPSQIMENWATEPQVLRAYAKHYKTGEVIPENLIKKIQSSGHFNQGFVTMEYLGAALLDLNYHKMTKAEPVDINKFEKTTLGNLGLIPEILPRYRSTYFGHIFSDGYAAGYYVYIWAAVLDADAFNAFKQSGDIYNEELAAKFRKNCLSEVGNDEAMIQYKKFRGQEPSTDPLLERRGLK